MSNVKQTSSQDRKTVLVIEDEEYCREIIDIMLQSKGYNVILLENGQQALEYLLNKNINELPSLVITDLTMPIMDGYQLLNEINKHKTLDKIPFIVQSGVSCLLFDKPLKRAITFIEKPYQAEKLYRAIDGIIG